MSKSVKRPAPRRQRLDEVLPRGCGGRWDEGRAIDGAHACSSSCPGTRVQTNHKQSFSQLLLGCEGDTVGTCCFHFGKGALQVEVTGGEERRGVVEDAAMGSTLVSVDDLGGRGASQELLEPQGHPDGPLEPHVRRPPREDLAVGVVGRRDPQVDEGEAAKLHVLQVAVHDPPHQLLPLLPPLVRPQRQPVYAFDVDPPGVGGLRVCSELVGVHGKQQDLFPPSRFLERHDRLRAMQVPSCR
mmetsp:Transcript_31534/g.100876  ORF Transcript_31534/g.100876 Transcript_31534/m.100876 type:complete len:242 (+) Transcript_31534:255-980(+)